MKERGPLTEYAKRRRFGLTPEPPPEAEVRTDGQSFMVHKHHARNLHYDLRLEMEGVLASWAIPKGPSYDPSKKRLAVQTEDHPLAYGFFEGRIPEGEYGAGDSLIWDRGRFETIPPGQAAAQREKGHLHLRLRGEKLRGEWHLVRTRRQNEKQQWIFFKAKDDAADPRRDILAERPESVESGRVLARGPEPKRELERSRPPPEELLAPYLPPMLAVLTRDARSLPGGEGWFETKVDGFRALAAVSGGRVAVLSRRGLDLGTRFPRIVEALETLVVGDAVLDGEIAVFDERGVSRFELLQQGNEDRACFVAFDLLRLDGKDLRPRPLHERRDLLVSLLSLAPDPLRLSDVYWLRPEEALDLAEARGWEGVVRKDPAAAWVGARHPAWRKLKVQESQEFAVVGFTPTSTGGKAIGALLLAVADEEGFSYVGRVGTGFSARDRALLHEALSQVEVDRPTVHDAPRMRDARWVEPRLVAAVRFAEWTAEGRLRQPAFLGLRMDKTPEETARERPIEAPAGKEPPIDREAFAGIRLTHPERILYPRDGITKRDLLAYYQRLAGPLIDALHDRPLAFQHWNEGIDGPGWFHQNIGLEEEPWMHLVETPSPSGRRRIRRLVVDSPRALGWLAQNSVLSIHMWASTFERPEEPDWVVFDLDPAEGQGFEQVIDVARALKTLLDELSLPSLPKTSGKRGLHVLVPLSPGHGHQQAVDFALRIARAIEEVLPEVTLERRKEKRKGRLYLDCFQNGHGKTIVAPYSPRAIDGAPVSCPLRWEEVKEGLSPGEFHIHNMGARIEEVGDLFADFRSQAVRLPAL